jgi:isopentenyl-diphosphate delta-isomerase
MNDGRGQGQHTAASSSHHDDGVAISVVSVGRDGFLGAAVERELAHQLPGVLHLAVSLQVVDPDGRWLVQRRAASKAVFADLWANTCCTHPHLGEEPEQAAIRRVGEELGLVPTRLISAGVFVYRALDPVSGMIEHEMDHVFVSIMATDDARFDPEETSALARLTFAQAHLLVTSTEGAPWAGEVLRRSRDALDRLDLVGS